MGYPQETIQVSNSGWEIVCKFKKGPSIIEFCAAVSFGCCGGGFLSIVLLTDEEEDVAASDRVAVVENNTDDDVDDDNDGNVNFV